MANMANQEQVGIERENLLEQTISHINKTYGTGAVMRMSERPMTGIAAVSSGSVALDIALGIGGFPRGRIAEVFGAESAGKSTLALSVVAQAQKMGGSAAYVDTEHALDPGYARNLGVKLESMLISQPDSAEQALDISEHLIRSGALDILVLDSVAALVPSVELEGEMGNVQIGAQARLMSRAMRKLTGTISKTNTVAIFINQLREKVGMVFGNPEVTPGGRALKFHASVRVDLRRVESIKSGDTVIGNRIRSTIVKNKVSPPFRKAEFDIIFNEGISREGELLDMGVAHGALRKRGAFYSFGDIRLGQGREAARNYLKEDADICERIDAEIRVKAGISHNGEKAPIVESKDGVIAEKS